MVLSIGEVENPALKLECEPHIKNSKCVMWCGVMWCGVVWCGVVCVCVCVREENIPHKEKIQVQHFLFYSEKRK